MSLTGVFQRCSTIDEKHSVSNVVFLAEFGKERVSENVCSGRFKLCVEYFVRFRIDCGVQPVAFIVELDHSFADHNVVRIPIRFGL